MSAPFDPRKRVVREPADVQSQAEQTNRNVVYHGLGGPRPEEKPYVASDGTRHYTLPERMAWEADHAYARHKSRSGESFVDERLAALADMATRHRRDVRSIPPATSTR